MDYLNLDFEEVRGINVFGTARSGKSVIISNDIDLEAMQSELVEVISEPDDAYWKEPLTLTMTPEQGRKWRDTTI